MKSLLFCTSYVGDSKSWNDRYVPWLKYYSEVDLGADKILMIDDCSPYTPFQNQIRCVNHDADLTQINDEHLVLRFSDRLGRSSLLCYPGWWRSFLHSLNVARQLGAQKIIHIESDAYILSPRLAYYIRNINTGWTTLWSEHFRVPETAIQVICEDQFDAMASFQKKTQDELKGKLAENLLPFTRVEKCFKGDRYGDIRQNRWIFRSRKFHHWPIFANDFFWAKIPDDADFVSQMTERLWNHESRIKAYSVAVPGSLVR